MTNIEEWRDIQGYEGLYQVSNSGKVRSLNFNKTGESKERKPSHDSDGYLVMTLHKNGVKKMYKVHRLVALAFLKKPVGCDQINHIDEDKDNNDVSNLEWCTVEYNLRYGTRGKKVGEKLKTALAIPVLQMKDGIVINQFISMIEASRQTGICQGSISNCCKGKRKNAGGYQWKIKTS